MQIVKLAVAVFALIVACGVAACAIMVVSQGMIFGDVPWKELREEKRREREDRKNLRFLSAWKWDMLDGLIESGIIPADEDGFITQEYVKKYELFWTWVRKNLIK